MRRKLITLLFTALSFLPLKGQQVFTLNGNSFSTKGPALELRIDNHNDLKNSQGYFRTSLNNLDSLSNFLNLSLESLEGSSFYFDRYGEFNHDLGPQQKNIFFNSRRSFTYTPNLTRQFR